MTELIGMHPRGHYAAAMERPPQTHAPRDVAAEDAALAGPQMFDCAWLPGTPRLSERQCLVNQERAAAGGFPSFCVACPRGVEIKIRHPEGSGVTLKRFPELTFQPPAVAKEKVMAAVQLSEKEAGKILGPQRLAEIMSAPAAAPEEGESMAENLNQEAPRCKKHPEEPQIYSKKGFYIGRCKLDLDAIRSKKKPAGETPAPPRRAYRRRQPAAATPLPPETPTPATNNDWRGQFLAKFPAFNPAWSPEVQNKWLDGFGRLCDLFGAKSAGGGGVPDRQGEVGQPTRDLPQGEASTDPKSGAPALKRMKKGRWDKKSMSRTVAVDLGLA